MSNVIVDIDALVRELVGALQSFSKVTPRLILDEDATTADDHEEIHLKVRLAQIAEPVVLMDEIGFSLLPHVMIPAMPLQKWWLDEESRWQRVIKAINEALAQIKVSCEVPDEAEVRQLPLSNLKSLADLDGLYFHFFVTSPLGTYFSFTEDIFFGEIIPRDQMDMLWQRVSRQETWYDRESLL